MLFKDVKSRSKPTTIWFLYLNILFCRTLPGPLVFIPLECENHTGEASDLETWRSCGGSGAPAGALWCLEEVKLKESEKGSLPSALPST